MSQSRNTGYERLNSSSDELLEGDGKFPRAREASVSTAVLVSACIVALLSLATSLYFAIAVPQSPQRQGPTGVLRRPNAYIGLERITFPPNTTFPPILNLPLATYNFSPDDPSRRLTEDDRHHMTEEGMVVPEDYHVTVSATRSTVMQFRAMDWGMEKCVLHLVVPAVNHAGANVSMGESTIVDVWKLNDTVEILPHISAKKAPARSALLASLRFRAADSAGAIDFNCTSGSFPTFEFSCGAKSADCLLDFWQAAKRGKENGFYLMQHWSRS
ncbi:hypothetical protein EXIGLDRAFT_775289 [Exidia glandulosa HHB12029]|uniref:Ubiquitin 3 binding protein But2 C-terminal domain-containing protein n=1 Tax=Exidia glandulosa HHB12029 TaxID=1314781 RepID=A0A165DZK6_EXIGL|nr:hypothetical protein EXIGLDRAFT_775289 [Exidia glandulosa HHB12029]